jgi:hypothetical protein
MSRAVCILSDLFLFSSLLGTKWIPCGFFVVFSCVKCSVNPGWFFCGLLHCLRRSLNSVSALPFKAIRILLSWWYSSPDSDILHFFHLPSSILSLRLFPFRILTWVFEKYHVKIWAGIILLKTGSNWPLWTRKGTFGRHKSKGILDQLSEYHPSGKTRNCASHSNGISLSRFWRILTMVYNTQNYSVFCTFPSSGILVTRKHDVSETGSVSVLR